MSGATPPGTPRTVAANEHEQRVQAQLEAMKLHTAEQIEANNKATQQMILAMQQQLLVAMQGGGNVNSPATVSAAAGVGLGHGTQHLVCVRLCSFGLGVKF